MSRSPPHTHSRVKERSLCLHPSAVSQLSFSPLYSNCHSTIKHINTINCVPPSEPSITLFT